MAKLTREDAKRLAKAGKPWSIQMEYFGSESTKVDKYWFATGRAVDEPVEIGFGWRGQSPAKTYLVVFSVAMNRIHDQFQYGYDYVNAPYRRMTTEALKKIQANAQDSLPSQKSLGEPWSLVRKLRLKRDGVTVEGYEALDAGGNILLMMTPQGALTFARDHDLEIQF